MAAAELGHCLAVMAHADDDGAVGAPLAVERSEQATDVFVRVVRITSPWARY